MSVWLNEKEIAIKQLNAFINDNVGKPFERNEWSELLESYFDENKIDCYEHGGMLHKHEDGIHWKFNEWEVKFW